MPAWLFDITCHGSLSTYSLRVGAVRNIIGKGQAICNNSSKAASYVREAEVALDGEEVVSAQLFLGGNLWYVLKQAANCDFDGLFMIFSLW